MIGWKVVRKAPGGTFSSAVAIRAWSRRYGIGERTSGHRGTPVLGFRTRQNARDFRRIYRLGDYVFRARLENARSQKTVSTTEEFSQFWAGTERFDTIAPDGTLACDAITLLERA